MRDERTLASVAAVLEIQQLSSHYAERVDGLGSEPLSRLFTADGELVVGSRAYRGAEALDTFVARLRDRHVITVHTPSLPIVELTSEGRATGRVRGHAELATRAEVALAHYRYTDSYVLQADTWLIQRRDVEFFYATTTERYATRLRSPEPVAWP